MRERTMASDKEERIRAKAHEIWLSEGSPEGSEQRHWDMATEIVEAEDGATADPTPTDAPAPLAEAEPVAAQPDAEEPAKAKPAPRKRAAPRAKKVAAPDA